MCYPDPIILDDVMRKEARRRAQMANKCEALRAIDAAIIEEFKQLKAPSIGEVLLIALPSLERINAGAADTVRRLLRLEGWV